MSCLFHINSKTHQANDYNQAILHALKYIEVMESLGMFNFLPINQILCHGS